MKNNYGITHALIVLVVMYVLSLFTLPIVPTIAGGIISIYYYNREKKARTKDGTPKFKDWYPDSQWDALSPIIATIAFTIFNIYL